MEPRSEGHPRVQRQDHVACLWSVAPPRGPDDQPPPNSENREVALPRLGPILLTHQSRLEIADRSEAKRLQVAKGRSRLGDRSVDSRRIQAGEVSPHDGRLSRVDDRAQALVAQPEAGLDAGSTRGKASQDLADRFDGLDVGGDRKLDPGARPKRLETGGVALRGAVGRRAVPPSQGHPSSDRIVRPREPPRPTPRPTPRVAHAAASIAWSAR